jgi:hypothetical protein
MKKRRDVGDLSFTEEEQRELREQEEKERSGKPEKPKASPPRPRPERQASLFETWFRSFGRAKTTRR